MSKPTAKEFLERVRKSIKREEQLREKVETLRAKLDGVGAMDYTKDNVAASSDGKALERRVIIVQGYESELQELESFNAILLEQATGMLNSMKEAGCPDSVCDELEYYYIWCMSTKEVSRTVHLSEQRLRAHRVEALKLSDKFVPSDAA